jgi:hypothetical protein
MPLDPPVTTAVFPEISKRFFICFSYLQPLIKAKTLMPHLNRYLSMKSRFFLSDKKTLYLTHSIIKLK